MATFSKTGPWIALVFALGLAAVNGAFAMFHALASSSDHVVAHWTQPTTTQYGSFDPYTLFVLETGRLQTLLATHTTHELRVVRGNDPTSYGYSLGISLPEWAAAPSAKVQQSRVSWTSEGVQLETTSGDSFFIPKQRFIGGR
jgi:hypothetical protein